jgi:hypothetical protein
MHTETDMMSSEDDSSDESKDTCKSQISEMGAEINRSKLILNFADVENDDVSKSSFCGDKHRKGVPGNASPKTPMIRKPQGVRMKEFISMRNLNTEKTPRNREMS